MPRIPGRCPKVGVARFSILSNGSLVLMKLAMGIVSGSVSIISEAIHSTLDLFASIIAFVAVWISDSPPDRDHPYGHGKYENVSGVIESLLILLASGWIIYEAIHKILSNKPIKSVGAGFIVMMVSAAVNLIVSRKIYQVAKASDSIALEADALHLKVDVYVSLGVGCGLLLIWMTGWNLLDPIVAMVIALFIVKKAYDLFKNAYSPLLDSSLPENDIDEIEIIIKKHCCDTIKYHNLRTRRAGARKYIDLHLEVPAGMPVEQAHAICDKIEGDIVCTLKSAEVNIHVEVLKAG
ncbi:MAG TPA: cation transporter [Nitrospiraceae bacterium]|nr:cation transporter [Nitrospiraceae bacterium]